MSEYVSYTIDKLTRTDGVAGQFQITVDLTGKGSNWNPDWTSRDTVTFVGSQYGGPVFVIDTSGHEFPIDRRVTDACGGILSREFIERFYEIKDRV